MFYKSSVLIATFILLSIGQAIASEIPTDRESTVEHELTTSAVVATTPQEDVVTAKLDSLDIDRIDTTVNHELPANKSNSLLANTDDRSNTESLNPESDLTKEQAISHFSSLGYVFSDRAIAPTPGTALQPNSVLAKTPDLSNVESFKLELDLAKGREIGKVSSLNDILSEPASDGASAVGASEAIAQTPEPTVQPEPNKWAVGVHAQASTTGFIGADVGYKFNPNLHARLGLNTVGFNTNYSSQGIDYTASLSPTNIHLLGDYFPFGGGLRFTGGLVIQNNKFTGTGTGSGGQVTLGTTTYNASDVGTIRSEGSFSNSVAPYVGVGLGTPINSGFGFFMDAGVMFAGSPTVTLSRSGGINNPQIDQDLAAQQSRTNNDIKGFNVYPAISIGFSYAF